MTLVRDSAMTSSDGRKLSRYIAIFRIWTLLPHHRNSTLRRRSAVVHSSVCVSDIQGSAAIARVCQSILSNLYDQRYYDRKFRSKYQSLTSRVEAFVRSLKDEKIIMFTSLQEKLSSLWDCAEEDSLSDGGLETILYWLSVQVT